MVLFAIYLVLVIALPITISALLGLRTMPRGTHCPNCAQETVPVVSHPLRIVQKLAHVPLQRRWCPTCEWDGHARIEPALMPVFVEASVRRTQEVRTLELGGREWHVMLESWNERGIFCGRLMFIGPSGKLWHDPLAAFNAPTHHEVLSQALALSDRLLAYRLREVISG